MGIRGNSGKVKVLNILILTAFLSLSALPAPLSHSETSLILPQKELARGRKGRPPRGLGTDRGQLDPAHCPPPTSQDCIEGQDGATVYDIMIPHIRGEYNTNEWFRSSMGTRSMSTTPRPL